MKVSVVIAVHNGAWCIERAIESLLSQTVRPDEILLCDDASTDGTPQLVEDKFGKHVTVLRLPRRNASATRTDGLRIATGDWLAFMDADDTWMPHKLERQIEYLREHPDVRQVSSDGALVSAEGVVRASWLSDYFSTVRDLRGDLYPAMLERCFVLMSSSMVEHAAYREVGGMDPEIVYSHDYDLWMKLMGRYPAAVIGEPLIHYFTSPGALSKNYEGRHRDDLALMRRAERGEHRRDPILQRRAGERAALLEYKLGVLCMRSGRVPQGREHLRRASEGGPLGRRLLSVAGSFVPSWAAGALKSSPWLKARVARGQTRPGHIPAVDRDGGAA